MRRRWSSEIIFRIKLIDGTVVIRLMSDPKPGRPALAMSYLSSALLIDSTDGLLLFGGARDTSPDVELRLRG
ncbi:hypothetical protein TNIN_369471 [Trichonephila inaurata madagascariensis]|uniref:Uncharacterized protein n=1 Tax=Trichonephila inaurata madagascariensis TaxID=2747483 RepID=A0A8X6JWQ1_9ARAC|nr:hypothetical protein TNIN_369471 [Trichonephila inaurata madagascariensis]